MRYALPRRRIHSSLSSLVPQPQLLHVHLHRLTGPAMATHPHFLQLSPLERWRWLGARIRWGLSANDPRVISYFLAIGNQACASGYLHPWSLGEQSLTLLLNTATDCQLPWHWRVYCLDSAYHPLSTLEQLVQRHPEWRPTYVLLRQHLARADMRPSIPPRDEPSPDLRTTRRPFPGNQPRPTP
jgi:hypothetical protein